MTAVATPAAAPAAAAPAAAADHPLYARLSQEFGYPLLAADTVDAFLAAPGRKLLVFLDDPQRVRESLDLAVIAPELAAEFRGRLGVGVLLAASAVTVARRFGFRRWPALVVTDGAGYVGAIDGLRDWTDYVDELARLMEAPVTRAPTVGIPVQADGAGHDQHCH